MRLVKFQACTSYSLCLPRLRSPYPLIERRALVSQVHYLDGDEEEVTLPDESVKFLDDDQAIPAAGADKPATPTKARKTDAPKVVKAEGSNKEHKQRTKAARPAPKSPVPVPESPHSPAPAPAPAPAASPGAKGSNKRRSLNGMWGEGASPGQGGPKKCKVGESPEKRRAAPTAAAAAAGETVTMTPAELRGDGVPPFKPELGETMAVRGATQRAREGGAPSFANACCSLRALRESTPAQKNAKPCQQRRVFF